MKQACGAVLRRNHGIYHCNLPQGHLGPHLTGDGEPWTVESEPAEMKKWISIQASRIKYDGESDAGSVFLVHCPECGGEIRCAVDMRSWWSQKCGCGYEWEVNVTATGTKQEADR